MMHRWQCSCGIFLQTLPSCHASEVWWASSDPSDGILCMAGKTFESVRINYLHVTVAQSYEQECYVNHQLNLKMQAEGGLD